MTKGVSSNVEQVVSQVVSYYSDKVDAHGPTHAGVDWPSEVAQHLRFEQLLLRVPTNKRVALNDYGCGYGALCTYLDENGYDADYCGFDLSEPMLSHARDQHVNRQRASFISSPDQLTVADWTIASGMFNVKLDASNEVWEEYVWQTLEQMREHSRVGVAFNMLTAYSDTDKMRDDLWYPDPRLIFDMCKRQWSRHVALLHDYGLWEFTILVTL